MLDGWLVTEDARKEKAAQAPNSRFIWDTRDEHDAKEDHKRLASDILSAANKRVKSVVSDHYLAVLQVFDAAALVRLHCRSSSNGTMKLKVSNGGYDT